MAFSNNNFDNSNSSLVVTALKSLTGLPIISQSEYWNQIHNGINNNAIYQNINPVSLHSSYLAGGEVQNNNDDSNPHYSLQGNENINQHDIDYSDSQFVSDTSFSTQESSHFCSANNTQVNPQTLNKINTSIGEYWISPKSDDIRPYDKYIKKCKEDYLYKRISIKFNN
ncbi:hypothetical protein RhiirC2_824267 [Rhizophagus irregularis]|uniref:Uncharacterized protein n=1 Tax=Rhizophagus irregularis TaxID=588596 RepID=A0A2N1M8L0_9GLOM|nr:hypothetical protein RhiirC2_824267 [Rhizophagus irregularis]